MVSWQHSIEEGLRQNTFQYKAMNGLPFSLGGRIYSIPAALAILPWTILKNRMNSSFSFNSSWCNSCNFILFFKSSWCNSSYSSNSSSAIHPFLKIIMVQFNLLFKIVRDKTASEARNWTNSYPHTEATTFAFSSVFIRLLWSIPYLSWFIELIVCYYPPGRVSGWWLALRLWP